MTADNKIDLTTLHTVNNTYKCGHLCPTPALPEDVAKSVCPQCSVKESDNRSNSQPT